MKKGEWDDINVNRRRTDKVYFESSFLQSISDKIDFLRDESKEILKEIDSTEFKQQLDEFDLEEFSEDTINQIDDIFDDISKFKDSMFDSEDFPEDVRQHYRNTQLYLNRDEDYVRRAKRKLARLKSDESVNVYRTNFRIIELCDNAIKINKDNFDAYVTKAQALINIEKYSEAIEEFITALSIKDDIDVWLAIADTNRLNEDLDDAINVYNHILEKHINHPKALKGKAYAYFGAGDYVHCDLMFKMSNSIEYLDEDSFKIWSQCLEHLKSSDL